jgi:galactonate dehydratase
MKIIKMIKMTKQIIKSYKLYKVPPRWLFLKIETVEGISGWGEPVVEGRADSVLGTVKELMDAYVVGRDAHEIEDIFQVLYRAGFYRGGPILSSAISGIEQALWDIKGKDLGVPIYQLMGGRVRDKMRVYCWIGGEMNDTTPEQVAQQAQEKFDQGYTAIKMNATTNTQFIDRWEKVKGVVARVEAIQETLGDKMEIGLDFHGRVHKGMAKVLIEALNPYHLMFVEEPVLAENDQYFAQLQTHAKMPIAAGERHFMRYDFKRVFELGGLDIIQPDPSHAGGIWETRKIAAMAEAYDVALAPHCPLGPIAFASCLQVDFCSINAFIQETSLGIHYNQGSDILEYLVDPKVFEFEKGYVKLLDKPGLGIEINEEYVKNQSEKSHSWKNIVWRNEDGSLSEW